MCAANPPTEENQSPSTDQNQDNVFTTAFLTFVKELNLCEDPSRIIKTGETRWKRLPKYKKIEYLQRAMDRRKRRLKMKCKPKRNHDSVDPFTNIEESSSEIGNVDSCPRRKRRKCKPKRRSPCCPRKKVPCKANKRRRRKRSCRR